MALTSIFEKENVSIFLKVPEQRALAIWFCRSKLLILLTIRLGARRMTFAIPDPTYENVSSLASGWILILSIILNRHGGSIAPMVKRVIWLI